MKGMKGKLMKKLKTVKQIGYLKPDRILQVSALDSFVDNFPLKSTFVDSFPFKSHKPNPKNTQQQQKPHVIDVNELMKDLLEEEQKDANFEPENSIDEDDKENTPVVKSNKENPTSESKQQMPLSELDMSGFRKPDMDSGTLFDPNLLAAFQQAVTEHINNLDVETNPKTQTHIYPFFVSENEPDPSSESEDPLSEFEQKCPPGGTDSVIFYTTSLRGIRKTFEDCQSIRFLLESFRVIYYERDVSIHSEFREELWRTMGEKVLPPRLFIKGRYIGGAEQVLRLNEQRKLRTLFREIPIDFSEGPCKGCSGLRFALCLNCDGSRKVFDPEKTGDVDGGGGGGGGGGGFWRKCLDCNENGLIVCPFCS